MIEKLDLDLTKSVATNDCIINKINELVDAVNYHQKWLSEIQRDKDTQNISIENVQDKFSEQRKWIGKLCWFWDDEKEEKVCGILTTIDSDCGLSDMCPYWNGTTSNWFEHCEPVKPDDTIIYKGGDNE